MKCRNDIKLIEISGDDCAACYAMAGEVKALADNLGLDYERVEAERRPEIIKTYGVERVPAVLVCDGEKLIAKCSGYQPYEILELWTEGKIEEYLSD